MDIIAKKDTYLKRQLRQANTLLPSEKIEVKAGQSFACKRYTPTSSHALIELEQPLKGFYNWYAFIPHWKFDSLVLNVPFFPQTDNFTQPDRTCNSSSCAMAAKYLGAKISGDDEYLAKVLELGDTTDHSVQTQVLADLGISSFWRTNLDWADLDVQIELKKPVVIGILHRGTDSSPTGGHLIVVIGLDRNGYFCHDPYGSLLDNYSSSVKNGEKVLYSKEHLRNRWLCEGSRSGWGRIFL